MDLRWPASISELEKIQRERKHVAVERARQSLFLKKRIPAGNAEDIWRRIPLLTKEELRGIPPERFHDEFCIQPRTRVVEYWRSGGATGRPLFYPRSAEDMVHGLLAFERAWALIGATPDDCAHISFPLGVHPVAHLYARSAINHGIGTIWCGAGSNTPSEVQLELIDHLKPTVWLGMASYGLHLANLAEAKGFDLKSSTVKKIIVAAEPLSPVKRKEAGGCLGRGGVRPLRHDRGGVRRRRRRRPPRAPRLGRPVLRRGSGREDRRPGARRRGRLARRHAALEQHHDALSPLVFGRPGQFTSKSETGDNIPGPCSRCSSTRAARSASSRCAA